MAANQALLTNVATRLGATHPVYLLLARLNAMSGGSGAFGASDVVFRPGASSTGKFFATWAEVEAAIVAAGSVCTLWFDGSFAACVVPNTANVEGRSFLTMMGASDTVTAFGGGTIVTVQSGAKFKNVRSIGSNLGFTGVIHTPVFEFDNGKIFTVELDSGFTLLAGSTSGFVQTAAGNSFLVRVDLGGYFDNQLEPTVPVVDASLASNFGLFVTREINASSGAFEGAGATPIFFIHDASTNANEASSYATGFAPITPGANDIFFDQSEGVFYDDQLVAPPFIALPPHAFNVQLALDRIKALLPATAFSGNVIVFDPLVPFSIGNVYKTWPEVQAAGTAARGPLTIMFKPGAIMTAPGLNYGDNLLMIGTGAFGTNPTPIETDNSGWNMSAVGLQIHDLEVTVRSNGTAPFEGTSATSQVLLSGTTRIRIGAGFPGPAFSFHGGDPGVQLSRITLVDRARIMTADALQSLVNVGDTGLGTAALELFAYDQSVIEPNTINYAGTGGIDARIGGGGTIEPSQLSPNPLIATYIDTAIKTGYDDAATPIPLGAVNVQEALDKLKLRCGPVYYSADTMPVTAATVIIPAGSGPVTQLLASNLGGVRLPRPSNVLEMVAGHRGDPANAGLTVTYELLANGLVVPLATVTLPADVDASGSASFPLTATFAAGTRLQVVATPSGLLNAPVTAVEASVG